MQRLASASITSSVQEYFRAARFWYLHQMSAAMKRLDWDRRLWLLQHARRSWRRKLLHRYGHNKGVTLPPPIVLHNRGRFQRLPAPAVLSFRSNHDSMANFVQRFRSLASHARRPWYVDFRPIRELAPAATLVLAAEFDRFRRLFSRRLSTRHFAEWDVNASRFLREIGFFDLLDVMPPLDDDPEAFHDTVMIRFRSDETAEGQLAAQIRTALEEVSGAPITESDELYWGLTEAMTNSRQHAYPEWARFFPQPIPGRWWLTGAYQRSTRKMSVIFFDQGVGIPRTLPRSTHWERARGLLADVGLLAHDDGNLIKAATLLGRTSTGKAERGRGLWQMRSFVDAATDGHLRILSGRGEYIYRRGGTDEVINHQSDVGGTLIEWEVSR